MQEIVTRGVVALPMLIEHLRDDRQTSVIVGADGFHTSKWRSDEYDARYRDPNRQPQGVNTVSLDPLHRPVDYYVLKVGDICYEAIGQIVNRHLAPIRYQPTACLVINSPVETPALARAVREDWGSCTKDEHIQSLIQDAHDKYSFDATMAIVRLCFYYPQTGEKVASDLLHRPLYDDDQLSYFIQNRLTKETDPAKWQSLIEAYVRTQGDAVREAIPFRLHWIYLKTNREKTEDFLSERNVARRILDQRFPRFEPWGKTQVNAAEPCEQADLIHSLAFFKSDIIDKAVLELAKRTIILKLDKPQARATLMEACKQRLTGTTYEEEFRQLRWDTIVKEQE